MVEAVIGETPLPLQIPDECPYFILADFCYIAAYSF
jgi:hypothetical protein